MHFRSIVDIPVASRRRDLKPNDHSHSHPHLLYGQFSANNEPNVRLFWSVGGSRKTDTPLTHRAAKFPALVYFGGIRAQSVGQTQIGPYQKSTFEKGVHLTWHFPAFRVPKVIFFTVFAFSRSFFWKNVTDTESWNNPNHHGTNLALFCLWRSYQKSRWHCLYIAFISTYVCVCVCLVGLWIGLPPW